MNAKPTRKLQMMNGKQFFLTIPNFLARLKGWKKHDIIEFSVDNRGNVYLKKEEAENEL